MADNIFEILIKYGLDKTKAIEAQQELAKLEKATAKNTEAAKEQEKVNIKVAESVRDQMNPALAHATEAMDKGEISATRATRTKEKFKQAVKGLAAQFPELAQVAQFAMSPVTLAVAGLGTAIAITKSKFDEAVRGNGGFELPDVSEDVVARYERVAAAAARIKTNLSGIKTELDNFNATKDIEDAFATGFGGKPGDDAKVRAQAAREAGDRAAAEAARLRGIAGPFNPNNAAAGDPAKMLPALQEHRKSVFDTLAFLENGGKEGSSAGWAAQYLLKFGLTDPEKMKAKYQRELSQTDAQISGIMNAGKVRGTRAGAFAGAEAAEAEAAEFYRQAARLGGTAAAAAGGNTRNIAGNLNTGDLVKFTTTLAALAKAITDGNAITQQALKDQESANNAARQRQ